MNAPSQLDPATLDELHKLGGPPLVCEMIDLFLVYVDAKIAAAAAAGQAGDFAALREAVHPIKSSASNIGAMRVKTIAMQLEIQAADGRSARIPGLVEDLRTAFDEVRPQLQKLRASLIA